MAQGGTDVGESEKWWERLVRQTVAGYVDASETQVTGSPANPTPETTPPEGTINDSEPYLLRVFKNPQSQTVLIGTAIVVGLLALAKWAK